MAWSYLLFAGVIDGVGTVVVGGWHGGGDAWGMFCTYMVVSSSLGAV